MTIPATAPPVDGRTARRDRNRLAVLDAVLELFAEGVMIPTPDAVARRSGVSLRTVYRHFADADGLLRAAIERHYEVVSPQFAIAEPGVGTFALRRDRFVEARLRGHQAIAAAAGAARVRAASSPIVRDRLREGRRQLRAQTELQFAPELERLEPGVRRSVLAALDALTQLEGLDLLRDELGDEARAADALRTAIGALLLRKY